MKVYVDADACPNAVKDILFKAANRLSIEVVLVANQPIHIPPSKWIRFFQVSKGFDVADNAIIELAEPKDLVITADIPLAASIIEKGASALNPRGLLYTTENIAGILSRRNFMEDLRSTGELKGGPPPQAKKDLHAFANALDRYLAAHK